MLTYVWSEGYTHVWWLHPVSTCCPISDIVSSRKQIAKDLKNSNKAQSWTKTLSYSLSKARIQPLKSECHLKAVQLWHQGGVFVWMRIAIQSLQSLSWQQKEDRPEFDRQIQRLWDDRGVKELAVWCACSSRSPRFFWGSINFPHVVDVGTCDSYEWGFQFYVLSI